MSETPATVLTVEARVHGRLLLDVPAGAQALLVGCHGYGEAAEDMLAALRRLRGNEPWALAAVQALHRFYRRSDGSVVGSWMTSQDRELAIADNLAYLREALAEVRRSGTSWRRLAWVGFSQGVAMAYRAAAGSGEPAHALVVLAGDVPPELRDGGRRLPPVLVGRGDRDEWYAERKLEADLATLGAIAESAEAVVFAGGHEWDEEMIGAARRFLGPLLDPGPAAG